VTPAPGWRALLGAALGVAAGTRGAELLTGAFGGALDRRGVVAARRLEVVAPLVVAETGALLCDAAGAVDGAGAGAGAAAAGAGSAAAGGVGAGVAGAVAGASAAGAELGAAVGDAGVPKPGGVQAQARAAPTTPTLRTDRMARQKTRTRCCTAIPLRSTN
jgi:hypothetical protein